LPERHKANVQGTTAKPLPLDLQLSAFPLLGDVFNTPGSCPLSTSLKAVRPKETEVTKPSLDLGDSTKLNVTFGNSLC